MLYASLSVGGACLFKSHPTSDALACMSHLAVAMQSLTQEKHSEEKVQELEQVRLCCIAVRLFMFIIRSVRLLKSFAKNAHWQERAKTSSTSEEVSRLSGLVEAGVLPMQGWLLMCFWPVS